MQLKKTFPSNCFYLEDELDLLDTKLIIPGGRRTRGKKIDYKQFGADPEDEE